MCTAITYKTKNHYFGRNLDINKTFNESVTITPRGYSIACKKMPAIKTRYAMIGIATCVEDYPLYYDATNEKGLSMAGLNFPGNACYREYKENMDNVTPYELIPWILSECKNIKEAKNLIKKANIINTPFNDSLPLAPLHWIISDEKESVVLEPMEDGIKIYDNPIGILTNNPTFDIQLFNLNNYINLSAETPANRFCKDINLKTYSLGMGAIGLPGDSSSTSRFVKAAFTKLNSELLESETESINQFFHILASVAMPKGNVKTSEGDSEYTAYSSCCNTTKGIYYYTTYNNSMITAVDMNKEDLDTQKLISYPLITESQIKEQN